MSEKRYLFRRDDTGEIVELSWVEMMEQDRAGYVTLPDGVQAKRCIHLEMQRDKEPSRRRGGEARALSRPIISDSLGFSMKQLAEFEQDRVANGHVGIEFVQDPTEPTFCQVKAESRGALNRYMKHRGFVNRNSFGGVRLTEEDFANARRLVERVHCDA